MISPYSTTYDLMLAARDAVRVGYSTVPRIAIILGMGMCAVAELLSHAVTVPHSEIPGFDASSAMSSAGALHIGELESIDVGVMQGRFHCYEGYSLEQVSFPALILSALGCRSLIVSNAYGCVNPATGSGASC